MTAWLPTRDKMSLPLYFLIKCKDNNKWWIRGTITRKLLIINGKGKGNLVENEFIISDKGRLLVKRINFIYYYLHAVVLRVLDCWLIVDKGESLKKKDFKIKNLVMNFVYLHVERITKK